jgi:hypothetical protein
MIEEKRKWKKVQENAGKRKKIEKRRKRNRRKETDMAQQCSSKELL